MPQGIELRALNSERFRHRFLERSRPWILQHLTELLTPRTLHMLGADGRPNMEYIRDLYNTLTQMDGTNACVSVLFARLFVAQFT
jgi:hypothetical protein